ncbi:MAG: hypothetical protein Q8R60_11120 [Mycobacteriales bacterium]|nr:hypothetical protein [Mycobacteriales bacterium]
MTRPDEGLAPARRGRPAPASGSAAAPTASDYDSTEVARGQTVALLGALGRVQLKLDLLAREQSEVMARLLELAEGIDRRLEALESAAARELAAQPDAPAAPLIAVPVAPPSPWGAQEGVQAVPPVSGYFPPSAE